MLTADGVPLRVAAVVFYRVADPSLWVTRVKDGSQATQTLAQTTLRAALATHTLTDVLSRTASIAKRTEVSKQATSNLKPHRWKLVSFYLRWLCL